MRLVLCLVLAAPLVRAQEAPRASAAASKAEVTVAEPFTVEVTAEGPPGTVFTFPEELGGDEVELRAPPALAAPPSPLPAGRHRYQATVFTLGEPAVPPIAVKYRLPDGTEGEVTTAPIPLHVVSLLPKDPSQQKLADIRGPLPLAIGRAFWIALGIVLAILGALVFWALRRRRRAPAAAGPQEPEVPPDAEALRALETLAASGLAARGDFRAYYIALTAIAKRYLERRLLAPVLEMTTAETVAFLRDGPHGDLVSAVKDLAGAADRIKFARGQGLAAESERHMQAVRGLVETLEGRLRPKEEKAA